MFLHKISYNKASRSRDTLSTMNQSFLLCILEKAERFIKIREDLLLQAIFPSKLLVIKVVEKPRL
jgi:hypothetical protein